MSRIPYNVVKRQNLFFLIADRGIPFNQSKYHMNTGDLERLASRSHAQPRIIGRDSFTNAAVIVPLVLRNGSYDILLEMRSATISQGGEICFPGGLFDSTKDLTTYDTGIRELCEELGLSKEKVESRFMLGTVIALRGIVVDCYVATISIDSIGECCCDTDEVAQVFTIPVDDFVTAVPDQYSLFTEIQPYVKNSDGSVTTLFPAEELGLPQKYWHPWRGKGHRVLLYPTAYGPVWGLTAEIIGELVFQLKGVSR